MQQTGITGSALRDRVIGEIARLAAENGGRPPGCHRFSRITGVSHGLWHGKFWVRWSDAVREAGFEPNPKRARIDDAELLSGVAEAARHFGRIPTNAEMRMYRSAGAPVAMTPTLARHFGRKCAMLQRLKAWAEERPERADILVMLDAHEDAARPTKPTVTGVVYMLRSGPSYKIGCSRTPGRRVKAIADGLPVAAKVVHVIMTDDPYGVEAYWHRRFAERRTRGEWFRLSGDDVAAFRERKFQ